MEWTREEEVSIRQVHSRRTWEVYWKNLKGARRFRGSKEGEERQERRRGEESQRRAQEERRRGQGEENYRDLWQNASNSWFSLGIL